MASNAADRVYIRRSVLNFDPFYRIRVIRRPRLRRVIKHSRIESGPAACTGFKQDLRKFLNQPFIQAVYSKNIFMPYFSLITFGISIGEYLGKCTVHIPLHIGNRRILQDLSHLSVDVIHHFRFGKIQYILISAVAVVPPDIRQKPVRMLPEQVTVLVCHLRLKPQTKFHAQIFDFSGKSCNALRQFFQIRIPVSKRRIVPVPLPEPSVIQDKKLYTNLFCLPGDIQYLFFIKVKIGCFPVIDQDRSCLISPLSSCKSGTVQFMVGLTHSIHPVFRVYHHHLRSLEGFALFQFPAEFIWMDSHYHSCHVEVVDLDLRKKISTVDKTEPNHFSGKFICLFSLQHQKRVELMAAASTHTVYSLGTVTQFSRMRMTLPVPCPCKFDHFIFFVRQVKAAAHTV